jgi:hypothetical protein
LKTIPHYENYFLIEGITTCEVPHLGKQDLVDFDKKCNALTKQGIFANNVNEKRGMLLAINMPDGGVDALHFIEKNLRQKNVVSLQKMNEHMMQLLEHGILPMNRKHLYHGDLKSSNVLVQEEPTMHTRIIDWGLSFLYTREIPKEVRDRSFQYNLPFSNILFSNLLEAEWALFFQKGGRDVNYYHVKLFVIHFVTEYVKKRGAGHIRTMNKVFTTLFADYFDDSENPEFQKYDVTFHFVFEYMIQILLTFSDPTTRTLDLFRYFDTVYLRNVDVWGFVICYLPFLETLLDAKIKEETMQMPKWISLFKRILLLLLKHSDTAIPVDSIPPLLRELNGLLPHLAHSMAPLLEKKDKEKEQKERKEKKRGMSVRMRVSRKHKNKKQFHRFIVKTLKNIQSQHSRNLWW